MLGNDNTKIAADKIVKDCLASENPQLKFCKSHLLLTIFDKKKTKIVRNGGRITEISTREPFEKPYSIQYDLVKKWVQGVVESRMVDGFYHQMEVLEFLFGLL